MSCIINYMIGVRWILRGTKARDFGDFRALVVDFNRPSKGRIYTRGATHWSDLAVVSARRVIKGMSSGSCYFRSRMEALLQE
jgi:hypothetical protein